MTIGGDGTGGPPGYSPYTGLTDAQIAAQAAAEAEAQLALQRAGIERQRQAAMAAAQRDQAAIQGLGFAQSKMLAPLPAEIAAIGNQAGAAIAGYGSGYSKQAASQIAQGEQQSSDVVAAQTGGTAQAAPTVDPAAVQNAAYAQGGDIPATAETQTATASANAAAGMPAVVSRAATEDIQQRMAEAAAQDADYRQQLIDLEAQRPGLVSDAIDRLQTIEANKRDVSDREQQAAIDNYYKGVDASQNQQQIDLQKRAELANEAAMGSRAAQAALAQQDKEASLALRRQQLKIQNQKQAWAVQNAQKQGHKIDAAASKAIGYIVDVQGRPVLDEKGNRIPVQKSASKGSANQRQKQVQAAGQAALTLRGKPVDAPTFWRGGTPQGKYIARRGAKGVFPDGTTNDPSRAQHQSSMTRRQAVNYLANTYGISKSQANKILESSGWPAGQ